jgi:transcriptional regulator with XRE-family HTH domain
MISKQELLKRPNYLLTKYQNEIFRQVSAYMLSNNLSQKQVAEKLGVSNAYVSQILNGNFNFALKKLIEIGLMIGKVPTIEFLDFKNFQRSEKRRDAHSKPANGFRLTKTNFKILSPRKRKEKV